MHYVSNYPPCNCDKSCCDVKEEEDDILLLIPFQAHFILHNMVLICHHSHIFHIVLSSHPVHTRKHPEYSELREYCQTGKHVENVLPSAAMVDGQGKGTEHSRKERCKQDEYLQIDHELGPISRDDKCGYCSNRNYQ